MTIVDRSKFSDPTIGQLLIHPNLLYLTRLEFAGYPAVNHLTRGRFSDQYFKVPWERVNLNLLYFFSS